LTVYILPAAIVLIGAAGLAFALPRWRRRTRAFQAGASGAAQEQELDPAEARRLEEDLARHGP
jgi:hypothetical protein